MSFRKTMETFLSVPVRGKYSWTQLSCVYVILPTRLSMSLQRDFLVLSVIITSAPDHLAKIFSILLSMDVCCVIYYLSRLVSNQDNFPEDRNGQKSFLCLVSSRSELMALTQRKLSCPFPSWGKLFWVETSLNSAPHRWRHCPWLSAFTVYFCILNNRKWSFEIPWESILVCLSAFWSYKYQLYATLL